MHGLLISGGLFRKLTATVEIAWSEEARTRVERAPAFVRPGMFLTEIRDESMLRVARCIRGFAFEELRQYLARIPERGLPGEVVRGAEAEPAGPALPWTTEAEERLRRVPIAAVRTMVMRRAERGARECGLEAVDLAVYERVLAGGIGPPPQGF